MPKSVVVFGQGSLSTDILTYFNESRDYQVSAVVPSLPERPAFVSLTEHARGLGLPVVAPDDLAGIGAGTFDLGFSCYYNKIMKDTLLSRFTLMLNLHNSPLPKYRGVRPVNWALENGEHTHGVTIHQIEAGIDTGPIYGQCTFSIDPAIDEVLDVYQRCLAYGRVLFHQTVPRIWQLSPVAQDDSAASTYTGRDASSLRERTGFSRNRTDSDILEDLRL